MKKEENYFSLKEYVTCRVKSIIDSFLEREKGWVFVLVGLTDIIDTDGIKQYIDDQDTFLENGNSTAFDKTWFKRIFANLVNEEKTCQILSYPQYAYLTSYFNEAYFDDWLKVVFIRDNIRQLYMMNKAEYIAKGGAEEEARPDALPLYQAEQLCLDEDYYYTLVAPSEGARVVDVFENKLQLDYMQNDEDIPLLDITSDKYALDIFINDCFRSGDLSKEIVVKCFQKQPNNPSDNEVLQELNFLLNLFGGRIILKREGSVKAADVRQDTLALLKKYWGTDASFRNLKVYGNPNINKEIVEISQGMLVETIIDEYENAKKGILPRDLFLTAPTGAGKSLLFQLPAFYISQRGDVTIIVSPLIALMKDQVKAIINDRHFEKVAYINSELNMLDRNRIIEDVKAGLIDVVYLSPELLLSYDLSFLLGRETWDCWL